MESQTLLLFFTPLFRIFIKSFISKRMFFGRWTRFDSNKTNHCFVHNSLDFSAYNLSLHYSLSGFEETQATKIMNCCMDAMADDSASN